MKLCAGFPIALAVAGSTVATRIVLGFDFEHVCTSYVNDLTEKVNFGATILDGAIKLSLEYLDVELRKAADISSLRNVLQLVCSGEAAIDASQYSCSYVGR